MGNDLAPVVTAESDPLLVDFNGLYHEHFKQEWPKPIKRSIRRERVDEFHPIFIDGARKYFDVDPTTPLFKTDDKGELVRDKKGNPIPSGQFSVTDLPTITGLCVLLDCTTDTLLSWRKKYPEFNEVVSRGIANIERILVSNGLAGRYQATFAVAYAKHALGWEDKSTVKLAGHDGGAVKSEMTLSPEQAYLKLVTGK